MSVHAMYEWSNVTICPRFIIDGVYLCRVPRHDGRWRAHQGARRGGRHGARNWHRQSDGHIQGPHWHNGMAIVTMYFCKMYIKSLELVSFSVVALHLLNNMLKVNFCYCFLWIISFCPVIKYFRNLYELPWYIANITQWHEVLNPMN